MENHTGIFYKKWKEIVTLWNNDQETVVRCNESWNDFGNFNQGSLSNTDRTFKSFDEVRQKWERQDNGPVHDKTQKVQEKDFSYERERTEKDRTGKFNKER